MFNDSGSPTIANCTFAYNTADYGAAMRNINDASPTVTNCLFLENSAHYCTGGMFNSSNSNPIVTNCSFIRNHGDGGRGRPSSSGPLKD